MPRSPLKRDPRRAAIQPSSVPMSKAGGRTVHSTRPKRPKWGMTRERTGATAIAPNHSAVMPAANAQRGIRSRPAPSNSRRTVVIAAACARKYRECGIALIQNRLVRTKAMINTVAVRNPRLHAHGRGSGGKQSARPAAPAKPSTIPASRQRHRVGAAGASCRPQRTRLAPPHSRAADRNLQDHDPTRERGPSGHPSAFAVKPVGRFRRIGRPAEPAAARARPGWGGNPGLKKASPSCGLHGRPRLP